ncbi:hypothetical protein Zmor_026229 [Zophobas morio]|uniref:Uronyl 2-sulfotransferase n=1 Tax=Zophobas morio TaxID=2755281 RepID=A0AA38HT66_9CUCU|nr:hypothetical protein Zmor_026229 [Zophobas morio]
MYRKLRQQWLLIPVLIMVMFSGSFLFMKNHHVKVYYVRTTVRTTEMSISVLPVKHVTKSLAQLGKMDEINKFVLFLNQVPNCGAEVLIFLLQKMQGPNSYRHVRLKGGTMGKLDKIEQEEFVDGVYTVMREEAVPLSFDRQMYFVNYTLFDKQSPTYINLIREPADKALSRSFYHKKDKSDKNDLVYCLIRGKSNCTTARLDPEKLTVPYFCGHDPKCFLNNQWSLQTAKRNVERYYPVVGVLEEMNTTLDVFEHKIPYFFKGVQNVYKKKMIGPFTSKKTRQLRPKIRKHLQRILAKEYDFYNWAKRRLFKQLQMLYGDHHSH